MNIVKICLIVISFLSGTQATAQLINPSKVEISNETRDYSEFDGRLFETIDDMIFELEGGVLKSVQKKDINKWPNGVLPIAFEPGYSVTDQNSFWAACSLWESAASVRCIPRTNQTDYIYVVASSTSNSSFVGKIGGAQTLELVNRDKIGIVAHELAHALGFSHQHNAPARDRYVEVKWVNIKDGKAHNFERVSNAFVFGGYDFCSIMHYKKTAFSKNGQPTLIVKSGNPSCNIGQRTALSNADKLGMAGAYGQDQGDEKISVVPNLIGRAPYGFKSSDVLKSSGVRTAVIEGESQSWQRSDTICEITYYTPKVVWQSHTAGTKVPFGIVVSLKTKTESKFVFVDPPAGQHCP